MASLQTTLPHSWRRTLTVLRAVMAKLCVALFLFEPRQANLLIVSVLVAYAIYATLLIFRDPDEVMPVPAPLVISDIALVLACFLHGGLLGSILASLIFFFVLTESTLLHHWRVVTLVSVSSIAAMAASPPESLPAAYPLMLAAVCAVLVAFHRGGLQDRLAVALRRSVMSRAEAESARDHERQRIAADFHDGPLQSFISFQMRLEIIRKMLGRDTEAGLRELVQLQELGRSQVTELRAFVRGMQPAEVKPSNLQAAIREAVEHFERDSGITADLTCSDLSMVEDDVATELLQLVREALNNARKHSKASKVSLTIDARGSGIDLRIEDDGTGFGFGGSYTLDELEILRLGPRSIKRRVRTLGGDLALESRPTAGASLKIRIPT